MGSAKQYSLEEQYQMPDGLKRSIFTILGIGIVLMVIGMFFTPSEHGSDHGGHGGDHSGDHAQAQIEKAPNLASAEDGEGDHDEASHGDDSHSDGSYGDSHDDHSGDHAGDHSDSGEHDAHATAGQGDDHHAGGEHHGHGYSLIKRIYVNLWHNSVYFTGMAIIGLFFFAVQYSSMSGWSAAIQRVPLSFSNFLPIGGVLLLVVFLLGNHDLFHWTHGYLYEPNSPEYDALLAGKRGYLNIPFYLVRMVIFLAVWTAFAFWLKKLSYSEDALTAGQEGNTRIFRKMMVVSTVFIIFFAISSSIAAWDWVMSIDPHWFSTMFGWYMFSSWFAGGLAGITLTVILLKQQGFLQVVNENHLHDLGKYVFAFSIFWTYIWFSQYLLIYYANIPEETVYFLERFKSPYYFYFIFIILGMNFFFPFLGLMTRDSKRKMTILKLVCWVVIVGHWLDFFLMITPGTMKSFGTLGLLEVGMFLTFLGAFAYVTFFSLTKGLLIPKNHPMIQESVHLHVM